MPEVSTEVRVIRVDYACDECGSALQFTGVSIPATPPMHLHVCPSCRFRKVFRGQTYPRYEPVKEGESV